ncbi:hypothetical protein Ldro_2027 [Legionella drozanskii LLAP-1]|uniref:Uncharacterized protein n=2 Tax=Legionella drozanskii TaxID=96228 RepID=A0A0W0SQM5_9GAMM|nr:hypothetical protein Ldro_2027 [Legionella drozanskii LLAP-1]
MLLGIAVTWEDGTMLEYAELQNNAKIFPVRLAKAYAKQPLFGSFFTACFPTFIPNRVLTDAQLIQQIAEGLEYYTDASITTKKLVLIGIYIYLWHQYDNNLQWLLNKPLLTMFQEQLGVNSLSSLDQTLYESSLDKLSDFSYWVFSNRRFRDLQALYEAFPAEMQGRIYTQRRNPPAEYSSWMGGFPDMKIETDMKKNF